MAEPTDSTNYSWVFPDCWRPPVGDPDNPGHEALCVLNDDAVDVRLRLEFFFPDRPPVVADGLVVGARRVRHFRLDDASDTGGFELPEGTDYGLIVSASARVNVQYTRVDTRSPALALMTTAGQFLDRA
jgi:hypothetical protein